MRDQFSAPLATVGRPDCRLMAMALISRPTENDIAILRVLRSTAPKPERMCTPGIGRTKAMTKKTVAARIGATLFANWRPACDSSNPPSAKLTPESALPSYTKLRFVSSGSRG